MMGKNEMSGQKVPAVGRQMLHLPRGKSLSPPAFALISYACVRYH